MRSNRRRAREQSSAEHRKEGKRASSAVPPPQLWVGAGAGERAGARVRSRARPPRKFEIKSAAATATAAADRELCQQQSREREGARRRQSRQPNEMLRTKDQPCKKFLQKRANHSPLPLSIPIAAGRDILGNVRVRRRVVILCTQTASSPDSESSFLFQILKLMEGRWTRAPSAMPAGQASRRVTRAFSSTSDGGGGGRCDRPSQYLLLTAFRYMERRRRREDRERGAKSKRPSCLLLLSPLISSASSVCIRAGRWAVRPRWLHRTRKRGRATFDLEENSFRFCPGDRAANLICRTLWADVVAEADSHGARSSRASARQKPKS